MADFSNSRTKLSEEERRERNRIRCRAYHARNREAQIEKMREYRAADPERTKRQERENYLKNKAGTDYHARRWARMDKEKARADLDAWKAANPDKQRSIDLARNERIKARVAADPEYREKLNKKSREWQRAKRASDPEFREKAYAATREWVSENNDWARDYAKKQREKNKDNPHHKIMASVRSRLVQALKGKRKNKRTTELLGAPIEIIRAHIEAQFIGGMSWSNWGRGWHGAREWHLDHIRPLASFDLTDPDQLAAASHYTNLQPLWAVENLKKGSKHDVSPSGKSQGQPRPRLGAI
jgi:hypothetical protein